MNFKKIILGAVAALFSVSAIAQNGRNIHLNNWFFGASGGYNIGFDGQKYVDRANSHLGPGTAANAYIGKYFSDLLGFRLGYQGLSTSNTYSTYGKDSFHYAHADLLFRAGNLLVPYIHAGYAFMNDNTPAGGVGLMLPIALSDRVRVIPDLRATALNAGAFAGAEKRLGANLSASLGLQIALGKICGKKCRKAVTPAPVPVAVPAPAPETKQEPTPTPETKPEQAPAKPETRESVTITTTAEDELSFLPCTAVVLFDTDSYALSDEACSKLDEVASLMQQHTGLKALVSGHTDNTGNSKHNLTLSGKRAKAVADYLVGKGISRDSISESALGESSPAATNDNAEGRRQNRRAEIKVEK